MALAIACLPAALPAQQPSTPPAAVESEADSFATFLTLLRARALAAGIAPATFDAIAPSLSPDPRVVALDRAQPGGNPAIPSTTFPPFAPYRQSHVERVRIDGGRNRIAALHPLLIDIQRKTGVPPAILLAIYGQETGYGSSVGQFDLLRSLVTLAHDGRRRDFFSEEFIATLRLIERGIPRDRLRGSWAGATGYPQFMPSTYLRLARDGDGDGRADIWRSEADALASIGAYLQDAGWRPGRPWGIEVRIPVDFDRTLVQTRLTAPRCPRVHGRHSKWLTLAEWRAHGLDMASSGIDDTALASLIEPDGPGQPAWLVTENYRSILDYNCSNFYALSVGLLADAIND